MRFNNSTIFPGVLDGISKLGFFFKRWGGLFCTLMFDGRGTGLTADRPPGKSDFGMAIKH